MYESQIKRISIANTHRLLAKRNRVYSEYCSLQFLCCLDFLIFFLLLFAQLVRFLIYLLGKAEYCCKSRNSFAKQQFLTKCFFFVACVSVCVCVCCYDGLCLIRTVSLSIFFSFLLFIQAPVATILNDLSPAPSKFPNQKSFIPTSHMTHKGFTDNSPDVKAMR